MCVHVCVCVCVCVCVKKKKNKRESNELDEEKKRGDARIELATSCTLSKNHTTRPITRF
jgi:Tfp pilus assembly protein PilF